MTQGDLLALWTQCTQRKQQLKMKQGYANTTPEMKQQSAVWVFLDENPPVQFESYRRVSKLMIVCLFETQATFPSYCLRTETRLRLTNMSIAVCLQSFRHGANGVHEWASVVYYSIMSMLRAHSSCSSGLCSPSDVQLATNPPYRGFPTRMVCLYYILCLRYTLLAGNPRYVPDLAPCDYFFLSLPSRHS